MAEHLLRGEETSCADPGDLLALVAASEGAPVFYWEHPARGLAIVGVGAVREIRAAGPERFTIAAAAATALLASIAAPGRATGGYVVGGFAFSDVDSHRPEWREFPALRLVVPELLWIRRADGCRLVRVWEVGREREHGARLAAVLANAADARHRIEGSPELELVATTARDERRRWSERVETVRDLIARGAARKVVLARRREILVRGGLDPVRVLAAARAPRPGCIGFAVRHDTATFLGSTPELLARRSGDRVDASALAGSAARGASAEEDRRLGADLLACPKNAGEHGLVVAAVRSVLERIAAEVTAPVRPELLCLPEAQHLHTAVSARLEQVLTALEIAGLLHPTPAVCGVPLTTARRLIERWEPERGWYTGAVGWMAGNGDGEFAVALRSALCDGDRATLWAGAGIVEGSNADSEFAETEAKMTALVRGIAARIDERAA